MNVFGQEVRTPLVVEASAQDVIIAGNGATTTVLANVASIHAVYIDVFMQATVDLNNVTLLLYAANKEIVFAQQIFGAIAANVARKVRWGGSLEFNNMHPIQGQGIGQVYDVQVTTANNAANGTMKIWTAARS